MIIKSLIEKIGKKRIDNWIFLFCLGLTLDGIFQFIFFWFQGNWIKSTAYWINEGSGYNGINNFSNYLIWFTQVYLVLFIPLIVYLGFKYKNSLNGNKVKILSLFILSLSFVFLEIKFISTSIFYQWIILFMVVYSIMILKFSVGFSFSYSLLSFQISNMLWEMAELNLQFGTILSYILVYSIFVFVLYKLKVKINLFIILSFIPILFLWINYYSMFRAWSTDKMINYLSDIMKVASYIRLFVFPFIIIITLTIYFIHRKYGKS